ncbi:MAG TPA: PQQ-dependent sugar dehydrogenase, partial [Polyangia bacterium]
FRICNMGAHAGGGRRFQRMNPAMKSARLLVVLAFAAASWPSFSACAAFSDNRTVGSPPATPVPAQLGSKIKLQLITSESVEAVGVETVPGEPVGRLFVVEKRGPIRILRNGKFDAQPFYDMTGKVSLWSSGNSEQGLLGMAFHPKFRENGRFFINYTDLEGDTRVVELRVDKKDPNRGDPASAREILFVKQPYSNHNAGDLEFGPDGKLYVLLGDGGSADDPQGNGQNPKTLLSKILRLDVDPPATPPTTGKAAGSDGRPVPQVLGTGLRNPWRYTFDRKTGDLYIADVGQNLFEMVHVIPKNKIDGPNNLGWNILEGKSCFRRKNCKRTGLQEAVLDYTHREGCSISGGYVYRGKALPEIDGMYFYSDFCTALLRSFRWKDGKVSESYDWKAALDPESTLAKVSAFAEDQDGELYLITHEGPIYKFTRRGGVKHPPTDPPSEADRRAP